jgi:hypothetical protein
LDQTGYKGIAEEKVRVFVTASADAILERIKPVADKTLVFRREGLAQPKEVELIPFYQNHFQRYAVYWRRYSPKEYQKVRDKGRAATKAK